MAYTTINKSTDYFNIKLYAGSNSTQAVTGVGFQPDWVWIKNRSSTPDHKLHDAVRGSNKNISSNTSNAEQTYTYFNSFDSDGFTLDGNVSDYNQSGSNFVSWNWLGANGTANNTDGSINSTVSANTTAGFSIVSFVGNATSGATVGHGLNAVPKVVIIKGRDSALGWRSYFAPLGATKYLELDSTAAEASNTNFMNDTAPTNQVFYLGNGTTPNKNGENYIAYCFAEKTGYSKFGSYTGNGSSDGTFVFLGFKPAFVIYKGVVGANATDNWEMADNKRSPYNGIENVLYPNRNNAEGTGVTTRMDFLSNGFKMRTTGTDYNGSGQTYIYMAFGQSLVGSNNIPATAR